MTNNEVEYEALIAGLGLAETLRVKNLKIYGDSRLVISQVCGEFVTSDEIMAKYVTLVRAVMTQFDEFHVEYIPREETAKVNALSMFDLFKIGNDSRSVYLMIWKIPSVDAKLVAPIEIAAK